jgi:hypothetical protein
MRRCNHSTTRSVSTIVSSVSFLAVAIEPATISHAKECNRLDLMRR